MSSYRPSTLGTVLAALLAAGVAAGAAHAQAPGGAAPPPPVVTVETVEAKTLPISYEYAGRVAASREIEVRARVAGILLDRAFEEGATVAPNQVLFKIDAREFEAQVALAEAQLRQSQATLGQARRTEERQRSLTRSGAVSTAQLDDATSSRELAEAQVAAAQASLDTARLSLTYATVTAPAGGITSLEQVPEGSLVSVNTLLTRISQLDPIYVNFSAADTEAIAIRQLIESGAAGGAASQLSVEVLFGDGSVYAEKGSIDFTSSSIDAETGTILSRAVLANPGSQLLPGQFVRVKVNGLVLPDAVTIPDAALMQGAQGTFVYTVDDKSVAQIRPVEIGRQLEDRIVVTKGLKAGDRVITVGVIKARPNAPVNVDTAAAPAAAPAALETPKPAADAPVGDAQKPAATVEPTKTEGAAQ
jgi:membrane fusion protein, multidrug efflux system